MNKRKSLTVMFLTVLFVGTSISMSCSASWADDDMRTLNDSIKASGDNVKVIDDKVKVNHGNVQIADENMQPPAENNNDTDAGINNVQFNMGYIPGKIGIYDNLTGSVFISGIEGEKICTAMWLYNGNPIPGYTNKNFKAYNGAKSAININLPRYYGMETNPKITFRLIYNNTVKESSKNVNVGYVPQAYYKQNEINAVMNKVYKIEIEGWTNKAVSVLSSPKGRAVQSLKPNSYLRIISKNDTWARVRTASGKVGYVAVANIRISNARYTTGGDLSNYDKNTWINRMGFASSVPYLVWVNVKHQKVNVFYGEKGRFNIIRVMTCATGKNTTPTNNGVHKYYKKDAIWNFDNKYYVAPVLRFNYTGEAFHSRPKRMNGTVLELGMGVPVSHGCVRMLDVDINWLASNLPIGATVVVW